MEESYYDREARELLIHQIRDVMRHHGWGAKRALHLKEEALERKARGSGLGVESGLGSVFRVLLLFRFGISVKVLVRVRVRVLVRVMASPRVLAQP